MAGPGQWKWRLRYAETMHQDLEKRAPSREKGPEPWKCLAFVFVFVMLRQLYCSRPWPPKSLPGPHAVKGSALAILGCGPPPWGGKSLVPRGTCPPRLCSRYLGSPRQNSRYPRISPGTPQAPVHCQDLHGLLPQIWPPLGTRLWGCGQSLECADWGVHTYVQTQHSAGRGWVVERGRQQVVPGCDLPSFESSIPFLLPVLQHYQATQHPDTE